MERIGGAVEAQLSRFGPAVGMARLVGVCHWPVFESNRRSEPSPNAVVTHTASGLTAMPTGGASPGTCVVWTTARVLPSIFRSVPS